MRWHQKLPPLTTEMAVTAARKDKRGFALAKSPRSDQTWPYLSQELGRMPPRKGFVVAYRLGCVGGIM
ncbi:hypothetical protein Ddc_10660 [Ditylenchus destructor]|nr:hypothetical protein Ddc_10660 [Ditylenchus destructor]